MAAEEPGSELCQLAHQYGIDTTYVDATGVRRTVPEETLRLVLSRIGAASETLDQVRASLTRARRDVWFQVVDDTMVVRPGRFPKGWTIRLPVGEVLPEDLAVEWTIMVGSMLKHRGTVSGSHLTVNETRVIDGTTYQALDLPFPEKLDPGYYAFHLAAQTGSLRWEGTTRVIVAPEQCYVSEACTAPARYWGINVQLYGVRSIRNWGIGDFRDLRDMMVSAGRDLGAAMVGINPLHALGPGEVSPYSPSSRLFHNPLYLNVESIPEFRCSDAIQQTVRDPSFQERLERLRRSPVVQYEEVRKLKWSVFERLYVVFRELHLYRSTARGKAFRKFLEVKGESLERFGLFQALQEHFSNQGESPDWRRWPSAYRDPTSRAVEEFSVRARDRVQLFQYLEWECQLQLKQVRAAATRAGMTIGLYQDLAVGVAPDGADAWAFQDQFPDALSIGAPPDAFNLHGQNWGLAPPLPARLQKHGYRLFAEMFRENMRHGGILRIDHVMGLFRLFWVPAGRPSSEGTYVHYPVEDLLGVLALESHHNRTMVIGEDLGTVTAEIRTRLQGAGLLSYRLLLFEKLDGAFATPRNFPEQALAAVTTHDLPTLWGFWIERDIWHKERLGLYPTQAAAAEDRETRRRDRQALLEALDHEKLLPEGSPRDAEAYPSMTDALCQAVYRYLARSPSRMLTISLEDLLGDEETPNLPGVLSEGYPVWRRKTGAPDNTVRSWAGNRRVRGMAEALNQERGSGRAARSG